MALTDAQLKKLCDAIAGVGHWIWIGCFQIFVGLLFHGRMHS